MWVIGQLKEFLRQPFNGMTAESQNVFKDIFNHPCTFFLSLISPFYCNRVSFYWKRTISRRNITRAILLASLTLVSSVSFSRRFPISSFIAKNIDRSSAASKRHCDTKSYNIAILRNLRILWHKGWINERFKKPLDKRAVHDASPFWRRNIRATV